MAILIWGSSPADFVEGDLSVAVAGTGTTSNAGTASEGIGLINSQSFPISFPASSEIWLSAFLGASQALGGAQTDGWIEFRSGATPVARIDSDATGQVALELWTGSAWSEVTGQLAITANAKLDIRLKVDAAGAFELYRNGVAVGTFGGNTLGSGATTVDTVIFRGPNGNAGNAWASIFVADEDTRAITMVYSMPTGNGALQNITGGFGQVNETGSPSGDASVIAASAAGLESTFSTAGLSSSYNTGYTVVGVGCKARGNIGAGSVATGLEALVRSGSSMSNGAQRALAQGAGGFRVATHLATVDPATGAAWTIAAASSAQVGARSKA